MVAPSEPKARRTTALRPPRPPRWGRPLNDVETVALASCIAVGAWTARPIPLGLAVAVIAAALAARRPWLLCIAALVLASSLAGRAEAGMSPARSAAFEGTVTLLSDPASAFGGVEAVVRAGRHRYQLEVARGSVGAVRSALAGERLHVTGRIRPPPAHAPWLTARHVVGRLQATTAELSSHGAWPWRLANGLRRSLVSGAVSLAPEQRSLFSGFVLGDDRDQTPELIDDFRGSGLSHLLVVSGENVAFVLALAGPILRRFGLGGRWVGTVLLIAFFALLTRFEPSVLRASVMAALSATAFALGRPASTLRLLGLAIGTLVLIDPLLVHSVGFGLSVAACVGIAVLGPMIRRHLPGPRPLADAAAVTLSAQVGVAPVQLAVFGGLPVASLPANLLAAPAAGLVMMWGLGAGLLAGVVHGLGPAGGGLARGLHWPTRLAVGWVQMVAQWSARLPLGEVRWPELLLIVAGLVLLVLAGWRTHRGCKRAGLVTLVLALLMPGLILRHPSAGGARPAPGVVLWRGGGATVVVLGSLGRPERLLEGLRRAGVRRLDVVVTTGGGGGAAALVAALRHRWPVHRVVAPAADRVPGAIAPVLGDELRLGSLHVVFTEVRPRLTVRVQLETASSRAEGAGVPSPGAPRARAPPFRRDPPRSCRRHPQPHAGLVLRRRSILGLRRLPGQGRATGGRRS